MDGVAAKAPDPALAGFLAIFKILEAGLKTASKSRLKRIVTLTLGERPLVVVCLDSDALKKIVVANHKCKSPR